MLTINRIIFCLTLASLSVMSMGARDADLSFEQFSELSEEEQCRITLERLTELENAIIFFTKKVQLIGEQIKIIKAAEAVKTSKKIPENKKLGILQACHEQLLEKIELFKAAQKAIADDFQRVESEECQAAPMDTSDA